MSSKTALHLDTLNRSLALYAYVDDVVSDWGRAAPGLYDWYLTPDILGNIRQEPAVLPLFICNLLGSEAELEQFISIHA